jgi:hypothetical protein
MPEGEEPPDANETREAGDASNDFGDIVQQAQDYEQGFKNAVESESTKYTKTHQLFVDQGYNPPDTVPEGADSDIYKKLKEFDDAKYKAIQKMYKAMTGEDMPDRQPSSSSNPDPDPDFTKKMNDMWENFKERCTWGRKGGKEKPTDAEVNKEVKSAAERMADAAERANDLEKKKMWAKAAAILGALAGGTLGFIDWVKHEQDEESGCFVYNVGKKMQSTKVCKENKTVGPYCSCNIDPQAPATLYDKAKGDCMVPESGPFQAEVDNYKCDDPDNYKYNYKVVSFTDAAGDAFNALFKGLLDDAENLFMKFLKDLFNGPLKYLMYGLIALIAIVILIKVF